MSDQSTASGARDRRRDGRVVLVTLALVLLVWFVFANAQKVKVHFWIFSANVSLITVILLSAALGAVLALLLRRRSSKP